MAASIRQLLRVSGAHVKVTAAAAEAPGRTGSHPGRFFCRCLSDAAADRNTHFGFETVPEAEKAKKGEPLPYVAVLSAASLVIVIMIKMFPLGAVLSRFANSLWIRLAKKNDSN